MSSHGSNPSLNRDPSPSRSVKSSSVASISTGKAKDMIKDQTLMTEIETCFYSVMEHYYKKEMGKRIAELDEKLTVESGKIEEQRKQKLKIECILRVQRMQDVLKQLSELESICVPGEIDPDFMMEKEALSKYLNILSNSLIMKNFNEECDIGEAFQDLSQVSEILENIHLKLKTKGIDNAAKLAKKYTAVQDNIFNCQILKKEVTELLLQKTCLQAGLKSESVSIDI